MPVESQQANQDNQHNHEIPYAIVKLEEAARTIKQATDELPTLRKRLDKLKDDRPKARDVYGDLQRQQKRLLGALGTAVLSLMEMELPDLADHSAKLSQSIGAFNLMTPDYAKLCAALSGYLDKLPLTDADGADNPEAQTTNAAIIGRLMATVKMGYYPTETAHIKHLVRGIQFPEGVTTNLFDPCCGCGLALRTLAQGNNCYTYGVELDSYRAQEALSRLHRVGFGSFYHSRISNEAFHAMLLNPPYMWTLTQGGNNARSEKRFLVDSVSHLMYGGLLIYIIPFHRLTADIAKVLCDCFDDLTAWRFMGDEFKKYKQIAILGTRRKRQDGSDRVPELASLALSPEAIPELSELPGHRYQLPDTVKKVELFKGSEFNTHELAQQLKKSTSFSRLFTKNKLDSTARRPLLPLNIGQVGLIGGSGLINGLVECDFPHVIKGKVVKENRTRAEENLDSQGYPISTTLYETRSNKLVFNLLTPRGFISLTDYAGGGSVDAEKNTDMARNAVGCDEAVVSAVSNIPSRFAGTAAGTRVPLGQIIITANARHVLTDANINSAIQRHRFGDWGDVCETDRVANERAIKHGDRLLSSYTGANETKFWVITEADRSHTTVLLPGDY